MSLTITAKAGEYSSKLIEVTVKNTGLSECHTRNPLHSPGLLIENAVRVKDSDGRPALYTGPVFSRNSLETVALAPKQEVSFLINLSESYLLERGKHYSARYAAFCEENPQDFAVSNTLDIAGEDRNIRSDAGQPAKSLAELQRDGFEDYNYLSDGIKTSRYAFPTTNDLKIIDEIVTVADESLANLKHITQFRHDRFMRHYNAFICDETSNGLTSFEKHTSETFNRAIDFLEGGQITFIYPGKYCKEEINAYVFPIERWKNIYLCSPFVEGLPPLPRATQTYLTKLGTITHEITHKVNPCIDDYSYAFNYCTNNVKYLRCTDTQALIDALGGRCEMGDIEDHGLNQDPSRSPYDFNLNMYNANCLRFFVEDAYTQPEQGLQVNAPRRVPYGFSSPYDYITYAASGVALLVAVGAYVVNRRP